MLKVLITGASGFIGSYVLAECIHHNLEIAYIQRATSDTWRINGSRAQKILGDLGDQKTYRDAFMSFKPDTVIHLAWSGVSGEARNDLMQGNNFRDLMGLLDLCREAGVKHFIGLGSQAEYGPCSGKIDESQATKPTTYYGICKLAASLMAQEFCRQFGLRFCWVRVFSTYGPKDQPGWLIPYIITELHHQRSPKLTLCEQRWDYLYITDAAKAIVQLALCNQAEGIFNLGSGESVPLRSIVGSIRDLVSPKAQLGFGETPYRIDQVMHLEADVRKLKSLTNWHPEVSWIQGIQYTVESVLKSLACNA